MNNDVYDKLANLLCSKGMRVAPEVKTPELMDILHFQFTPEEAQLGLQMGFKGGTLNELQDKTGLDREELKAMIVSMQEKGSIYTEPGAQNPTYKLLPIEAPGLIETVGWGDNSSPFMKELNALWYKFKPKYVKLGVSLEDAFDIPIWCAVNALPPDSKPKENVFEHIRKADFICVSNCPCRVIDRHGEDGAPCEHLMECCFSFDEIGRWAVEQGFGRQVTVEETIGILEECEKKGQVHAGGRPVFLCNCCSDACINFIGMKLGTRHVLDKTPFFALCDEETCTVCGICEDRCQVNAIKIEDYAEVNKDKCIGCGVCVTGCPEESIKMVRRSADELDEIRAWRKKKRELRLAKTSL